MCEFTWGYWNVNYWFYCMCMSWSATKKKQKWKCRKYFSFFLSKINGVFVFIVVFFFNKKEEVGKIKNSKLNVYRKSSTKRNSIDVWLIWNFTKKENTYTYKLKKKWAVGSRQHKWNFTIGNNFFFSLLTFYLPWIKCGVEC